VYIKVKAKSNAIQGTTRPKLVASKEEALMKAAIKIR
jgi:hypothetical protein